jgi:ketosteroid isomerase-like protein
VTGHRNEQLLEDFYASFNRHDGDAMAAAYSPDAHFSDPVFVDLTGGEAGDMWRMLTGRAADLTVELVSSRADEKSGEARWIARYQFAQTGRPVVNDVTSAFRFTDGHIAEQRDDFGFWGWSRQALGLPGLLLGWTPMLRRSVQSRARAGLRAFQQGRPDG